jgi:glycosyltransferase involved in cell wall biosynthesis
VQLALSNHGLRNSGGIERYALTLVRGLHERGIRPVFIAKKFDPALAEVGWVEPVRVRMTGLPGKLHDLWFDRRIRAIKRRRGLFPLIACNQTGAADIAICGSTHPGYLEAMGRRAGVGDRWKVSLEHAHLHNARVIVAHSQRMADEAMRFHGVRGDKIRLLYPPVDGARFGVVDNEARQRLRAELALPADRCVFLLASTGHKRKGLDLLVEFFRATSLPVLLVVAGRPIADAGPNVRYLGYRSDIENVYRAVDFTILASTYEPFGLVGVESVLCGTPVLIAAGAGCAEVIAEPAQIAFDRARPAGLAAAIDIALARWRAGEARLAEPLHCLRYDPAVSTHVTALLDLADGLARAGVA